MYDIVCLIGESGSGKDSIFKEVLSSAKKYKININPIINCTTRPKRDNEKENVDYYFLTLEQFTDKLLRNELLEATSFNDWFYGTEFSALKEDQVNIGIFNPDAIYNIKETHNNINLWIYYLEVSGKERLIRQLNREEKPDIDEIIRRYQADELDFHFLDFHYNILNNENFEDREEAVKIILNDIYTIGQRKIKN